MTDLAKYGACTLEDDGCTTCGDVAVPVRLIRRTAAGAALCEDRTGRREEIMIDFTPEAGPGDVLLVHGGVAIGRVDTRGDGGPSMGAMDRGGDTNKAIGHGDTSEPAGAST